ncbi:FMN-binding negative transcriptional regulator [Massilia litorea]|jgi:transcriptional regulator|uniref:FMN-binding negative transcriptional regulator n=1 Tax=Massilia litorea TaxID=2769491 RepID=A0A7L9U0Q1_9BURK|nr:FMN-binding negative transcriptional regulator [Massilia litorea]QOL48621.1 FMN-binding negative transcriptional regulator [Massilia litorea]
MYIRQDHQLTDVDTMFSLIDEHALGAWVVAGKDGLVANHLPFLLDRSRGPHGTLVGHVARANPVWRMLDGQASSLVIFQGPQSYITPNWYPGKAEHGKVVPTWDYAVVHAHGVARAIDDPAWLMDMLDRLTNAHEAAQPAPWRVADAPPDYIDRLLRAIVGIEITVERFEGKLKASQDEAVRDRLGTVEGLRGLVRPKAALADLVKGALDAERSGA